MFLFFSTLKWGLGIDDDDDDDDNDDNDDDEKN